MKTDQRGSARVRGRVLTGRTAFANASFVAVAEIVGKLSTLVWTVVAAQQIGQFGFGAFNLVLALGLLLTAVGEWGFDSVLVRRGSRKTAHLSQYFTEAVVWQVGLAVPLLAGGAIIFVLISSDETAALAFVMVALALLCDMVSDSARAASSTLHRQGTTSAALIAQRVATAGLAIPAVIVWGDVVALSGAFLLSSVLGLVLHCVALHRLDVHVRLSLLSWAGMRRCLHGTGWVGLSAMIQVLQFRAGFIVLGSLAGQAAVGGYAAAYRLFETVLFLSFALVAAVFPLMSLERTQAGLRSLVEASVSILTGFYLPFAVVCVLEAPRLVELVFGPEYIDAAAAPLQWFAVAPLAFGVTYVGGTALVAVSFTKKLLISTLVSTTTCLGLTAVLVPRYGAAGAAAALTTALVVEAAIITVFLRQVLDRWPGLLRQVLHPVPGAVIVLVVLTVMDAPFLAELSTSALLYILCWGSLLRWSRSSAARRLRAVTGEADDGLEQQEAAPEARTDHTSSALSSDVFSPGEQQSEMR